MISEKMQRLAGIAISESKIEERARPLSFIDAKIETIYTKYRKKLTKELRFWQDTENESEAHGRYIKIMQKELSTQFKGKTMYSSLVEGPIVIKKITVMPNDNNDSLFDIYASVKFADGSKDDIDLNQLGFKDEHWS
jgi:hypothetical protein